MTYRTLFLLNSFVAFLLGAAFLVVPALAIGQFGVDSYSSTKMIAQFFGTAMLTLGLVLWFAKDIPSEMLQRGMAIAMLVGAVGSAIVTIIGMVTGALRTNGWVAILVYALFSLGYVYLVFLKPRMKE